MFLILICMRFKKSFDLHISFFSVVSYPFQAVTFSVPGLVFGL